MSAPLRRGVFRQCLSSKLMASPFAAQLGTNYCPKDEEMIDIKALLVEPTLRLKRLDGEIADLQKAIGKLAAERDELGAFVESHKALISPVRRLPLDIIQEIFIACIPTHRNCVMSASEAPVLLGRICSSWRVISLSTPRLWARLHVVEPPSGYGPTVELHNKKVAQRLEVTKTWLSRSGQCPLSISLQSSPDEFPPATPPNSESRSGQFLQALISFAPRWQHIRFTTPPSILANMSHLTATDVPMLESIVFHLQHRFPLLPVKWELLEMLRSPRISSFSVSGNNFVPEKLPFHWHRLTDLAIDGHAWQTLLTSEMVVQTFSRCPELRTCKLAINNRAITGPQLLHSVELRFLHTLDLDFGSLTTAPRLLERLSLPELHTFTLSGYADPQSSFSLAPFFGLWARLESLTIGSNSFSKISLLDTLNHLPPTLRRLSILDIIHGGRQGIELGPLDDDVLAVLAISCAALETLNIIFCSAISDEALLKFIIARMTKGSRTALKRVEIQFIREMTIDILPNLEAFIDTGLDISVRYSPPQTTSTLFSPWHGLADAPETYSKYTSPAPKEIPIGQFKFALYRNLYNEKFSPAQHESLRLADLELACFLHIRL
ncbi:hypothetical protein B0H19DRAFT_1056875 [Mycena capillaripes]|nr:hypothetical protein B0H19DRAFT_1056875 [Mycena capillaripes]